MMGLLQKCVVVPVMHFAPSGIRKMNSPVWYLMVHPAGSKKVAEAEGKGSELAFLSLFVITVNIVKR